MLDDKKLQLYQTQTQSSANVEANMANIYKRVASKFIHSEFTRILPEFANSFGRCPRPESFLHVSATATDLAFVFATDYGKQFCRAK